MYPLLYVCVAGLFFGINIQTKEFINTSGSEENNPWVYNVPKAFSYIPVKTDVVLSAWNNGIIPYPRYTQTLANRFLGIWGSLNHFQSIKRLSEYLDLGNLIVCAGTNPHTPESQLFIIQLESEKNDGLFVKNIIKKQSPLNDKLIKKISLSSKYWYTGSIDTTGQYLAIPVYNNDGSAIVFYRIHYEKKGHNSTEKNKQENLIIEDLEIPIERKARDAQAVAITRLSDGFFLVAIWTHGDNNKSKGLDFYCSKTPDITKGFDSQSIVHIPATLFYNYSGKEDYQNINFVNDFNGKLYLIALENTLSQDPIRSGLDLAHLFEIQLRTATKIMIEDAKRYNPNGITANLTVGAKRPYVTYMTEKHMYCKQGICNFSSGATIYIPDQQHIFLYSIPYYLTDGGKQLTFAQFGSIQKTYPK